MVEKEEWLAIWPVKNLQHKSPDALPWRPAILE